MPLSGLWCRMPWQQWPPFNACCHGVHTPVTHMWQIKTYSKYLIGKTQYMLVVYLPLWKIWVPQWGWWHSQYYYMGNPNKKCSSHHQPASIFDGIPKDSIMIIYNHLQWSEYICIYLYIDRNGPSKYPIIIPSLDRPGDAAPLLPKGKDGVHQRHATFVALTFPAWHALWMISGYITI